MIRSLSLALAAGAWACGVAVEPVPADEPPAPVELVAPVVAAEPRVVVSLPTDLALATPDVVIRLVFSTAMDRAASAEAFSLTAASGETVAGALLWDVEAKVLAFRPERSLAFGDYFVLVDERARSRDGQPLPEVFSVTFSVADPGPSKADAG